MSPADQSNSDLEELFREAARLIASDRTLSSEYEFLTVVGSGGAGIVCKVLEKRTSNFKAIKILRISQASENAIARFMYEAKLGEVLSHPNILSIEKHGLIQGETPYLVMPFIDGASLADTLKTQGALPCDRVLRIFMQVCDALAYSHSKGVLHRDIKPANIMLPKDRAIDHIYVVDFGLAKISATEWKAATLTRPGQPIGTPLYMSPEQIRGEKVDERTDIYSIACSMFECITGAPPFMADTSYATMYKQMHEAALTMKDASLGLHIPSRLEYVVAKALSKDRDDRFATVSEMKTALSGANDPSPATTGADLTANVSKTPKKFSAWSMIAVSIWLVVIVGIALIAQFFHHSPASAPSAVLIKTTGESASETGDAQSYPNLAAEIDAYKPGSVLTPSVNVTDKNVYAFRKSKTKIQRLSLGGSDITDEGLKVIAELPLEELEVDDTRLRTLSALRRHNTLRTVRARNSSVDKDGVINLSTIPHLESLDLSHTKLSDDDLSVLGKIRTLRWLSLGSVDVTDEAVVRLATALPNCFIHYVPISERLYPELLDALRSIDQNDPDKASAILNRLLQKIGNGFAKLPENVKANICMVRGTISLAHGQAAKARQDFESGLQAIGPGLKSALSIRLEMLIIQSYIIEKNYAKEIQKRLTLEKDLSALNKNVQAILLIDKVYMRRVKGDNALTLAAYYLSAGDLQQAMREADSAMDVYLKALKMDARAELPIKLEIAQAQKRKGQILLEMYRRSHDVSKLHAAKKLIGTALAYSESRNIEHSELNSLAAEITDLEKQK